MTDRPILFSAPMVRALLKGRKTQTRRGLSLRGYKHFTEFQPSDTQGYHWAFRRADMCWVELTHDELLALLRWQVGDRLWVKETHTVGFDYDDDDKPIGEEPRVIYAATECPRWYDTDTDEWLDGPKWAPSIFMRRKASRLTLTVTGVRVERLQDISEDDAIAEGCAGKLGPNPDFPDEWDPTPVEEYHRLWNSINGKDAWEQNPWVLALTFDVEQRNIDG